ncbi:MAG: ABC transporter permease subunit [Candidatus Omnitrophica bacterium]|nr:ABC transporter permease subunit [Candidatus Omnitrophota bacterium]
MTLKKLEPSPNFQNHAREIPERFKTRASTLFIDRFMTHFIKAGGIGIIAAVFGIFVFIFSQTIPLFKGAEVHEKALYQFEPGNYSVLGVDEWGELPFAAQENGLVRFFDTRENKTALVYDPSSESGKTVSAFRYNFNQQEFVYGTEDGHFFVTAVRYSPDYSTGARRVTVELETGKPLPLGDNRDPVRQIAFAHSGEVQLVAALQEGVQGLRLTALTLTQETSMMGAGELTADQVYDLTGLIRGRPVKILVNMQAYGLVVLNDEGRLFYLTLKGGEFKVRQEWQPFQSSPSPAAASMDYLLGDVSLVLTHADGTNVVHSLFVPPGGSERRFAETKRFQALPAGADLFHASLRNKAFLVASGSFVSLRYATTETTRWESRLDFDPAAAVIGRKYDSLLFLDSASRLHVFSLHDHHPESSWRAFFGKIQYEGYPDKRYEWQSSGSTDDFEAKLSLVPLIVGTLKGTLYAIIFAFPIALLAAIYTSQFAHPRFKLFVKPVMEIMASLPSVVLGFLSALWLAPLLETRVPSLILIVILIPSVSFAFGALWNSLPVQYRVLIKPGYEWIVLTPVLLMTLALGWHLGPVFERMFFVVTDPDAGIKIADFRRWWPEVTGTRFEQRNSLVVGFMMGFAVIPIIFTIAEDSLSNVPKTLVSGSLALGASRWQTALRVVVPTAFPGIFSAVMIGLGRAIGETMIVVMATGNTPIMDLNIFTGMRTLSANIAVELPEAPYLGTLYRTLFFGATVLFMMTFVMNTIAEVIRQRLREKYRTV